MDVGRLDRSSISSEAPLSGILANLKLILAGDTTRSAPSEGDDELLIDSEMNEQVDRLLHTLDHRGKGLHTCPYGHACKKGGVDASGDVVRHERNLAFK